MIARRCRMAGHRRGAAGFLRVLATATVTAILALSVAAHAQDRPRVPVDAATTQQKADYLQRLVTESVSVRTIEDSGDAEATAALERARALVGQGRQELAAGRYQAANDLLNQALALVNAQARRLSEPAIRRRHERGEYERRLQTAEAFLGAYERVAGEGRISEAARTQMAELRRLIGEAKSLAQAGQLVEATAHLERAYVIARGNITEMRAGQTLTRSLVFDTPAAEYAYERDRNESHVMLLRFALVEKQPPDLLVRQIEAIREEAEELRRQAARQAEAGRHPEAIDLVARSTDMLLRAIRMSGIYIPG